MSHGHSSRRLSLPAAASSPAGGILTPAADESNSPQTPTGAGLARAPGPSAVRQPAGNKRPVRRPFQADMRRPGRPSYARAGIPFPAGCLNAGAGIEQANYAAVWATWASGKTLSVVTIFSIPATLWPINALAVPRVHGNRRRESKGRNHVQATCVRLPAPGRRAFVERMLYVPLRGLRCRSGLRQLWRRRCRPGNLRRMPTGFVPSSLAVDPCAKRRSPAAPAAETCTAASG